MSNNNGFSFYGRRILKIQTESGVTFRSSGQWVGHNYGNEYGTERQRKNFYNEYEEKLLGVSTKIFWKTIDEETLQNTEFCNSLVYVL